MTTAQAAKAKRIPPKYRGVYVQAVTTTRRQLAIRAFCLECVAWDAAEVRRCTGRACPLFDYRLGGHPGAVEPDATGEGKADPLDVDDQEAPIATSINAVHDPAPSSPESATKPAHVDATPTIAPGTLRAPEVTR